MIILPYAYNTDVRITNYIITNWPRWQVKLSFQFGNLGINIISESEFYMNQENEGICSLLIHVQ